MEAPLPFEFGMPPRPTGLSPTQRRLWDYYTKELYDRRVLARSDQSLVMKVIEAKLLKDNVAMAEAFNIYEARTPFAEPVPEAPPEPEKIRVVPNAEETAKRYAAACISGEVVCGKFVRQACERFFRDLERTDLIFSSVSAQRAVDYIHKLGVDLLDYQIFILANLFGFLLPSGLRRFRYALILIARKNGKTTFSAAVSLYLASGDEEGGDGERNAQVYCVATTKYQSSSLAFKAACTLREANPWLANRTQKWKAAITWPDGSSFEPLASNAPRLAGLNVHGAIEDEVGDMPDTSLCSVLESGTVGRRQSLVLAISTAGPIREQICYEQRQRGASILEGAQTGDTAFFYLAEMDDGDDPSDESKWVKSNPALGVLVPIENLRNEYATARSIPSAMRGFLRFNLNLWTASSLTSWLNFKDLEAQGCAYIEPSQKDWSPAQRIAAAEARLRMGQFETVPGTRPGEAERKIALPDRYCCMGMDLALVDDLSAVILLFGPEREGGYWEVLARFFCPEENIERRSREQRVDYVNWARGPNPFIIATPGTTTDPDFIRGEILKLRSMYRVSEVGFDRAFGESLCKQLEMEGMKVTQVNQGFNLSSSIQTVERLVKEHKLVTWGNPVLNWCLSNVSLRHGYQETVALSKEKSREKIDGAAALCNAMFIQAHQPLRNNDPNRFRVRVL